MPTPNTPIRNRKVGLPDPQGNGQPSIAITGPSAMVQQMAAQRFALKNGGQMPPAMQGNGTGTPPPVATVNPNMGMNFFGGGNQAVGKYDAQPVQTGAAQPTDFTQMQQPQQFEPQNGYGNANPTVGPVATPYMKDASETTQQPQTNFEGMRPESGQGAQWNPNEQYSDVGYKGGPYDPSQYDSLSAALNGSGLKDDGSQTAQFQADPNQRDGGFFGWLKGLIPKKRPGKREGETDDEYDARRTRNMEMVATLADAIRHMGNIVNTAKGAPLQQFNDPTSMLEQGYQNRKAQRQKQAALDADAAYKQANLSLKERAAEADRAYKQLNLNLKQQAADRAAKSDDFNQRYKEAGLQRQLDNDKFNHDLAGKKFDETKRHNAVAEGQSAARIALAQERNGIARARLAHSIATGGSGGGGGKGGSLTNLSSPSGHLNRKKDLNSIEKKQITQHLIQNGYINKKNLDAYKMYQSMGNTQLANDLQNCWIAYAANMPGKKGDAFRSMLKNHYMYGETSTVSTTKAQPKSAPKKTTSGKPVGGGVSGGKSKNGYKNTKALGL